MLDAEVLQNLVKSISRVLKVDPETLSPETSFRKDLKIRSLELQAVVSELEEEYDLYINYPQFARLETIGDGVEFIVNELNG